ncbi:MAG: tetratricopeptide repeat protein [Planctomycetota bacterium]
MLAILRGFVAGFLLSCARAPLGIDLLQGPAVDARVSYGWRSGALLALAIGWLLARQATLPVRLLLGCALGFGAHALFLANAWSPSSPFALGAALILGLGILAAPLGQASAGEEEGEPPGFLELIGLAGAGVGAAIACEGVARHVRLLGGALSQDDSVFACVFLLLLLAGGVAFGWLGSARILRGISLPLGLASCAAGAFVSLVVIERLAVARLFANYLRSFGLDTSLRGMLAYDALVGAACFVVPGLLLGAALLCARGCKRIFAVLVGGALGLSVLPGALGLAPGSTPADAQPSSAELIPFGALIACGGSVVAILALQERRAFARWSAMAVALALAAPALLVKSKPIHVLSPWATRLTYPLIVSDIPEGLVTVESFGLLGGSWPFATLDRRLISPPAEQIAADALRLRGAFELIPAERKSRGGIRVLLVGQLTPERARTLVASGALRVDRTAAWHAAMERIEHAMWSQLPVQVPVPEGAILTLGAARDRLAGAEYDLVIVLPVTGDAPYCRGIDVPATTTVVRWIGIEEPAVARDLGDTVALTADGFEHPALGVLTNASPVESDGRWAPLLLPAGEPTSAPTPTAWLLRRKSERGDARADASRAAVMKRLAGAAQGSLEEDLVAGLSIFYGSQERSSQFETLEERTELPETCLSRLKSAVLAGPPRPFLRRTWESLARILARKRWIEEIYTYVQPVAEKHPPWPALEIVLAQADLESLAPADAVRRLRSLASIEPKTFEIFDLLGRAHCALGEPNEALEAWRGAIGLPSDDPVARKRVVLAVAGSGDPAGIAAAQALILEMPEDMDLRELLEHPPAAGPGPDPCSN